MFKFNWLRRKSNNAKVETPNTDKYFVSPSMGYVNGIFGNALLAQSGIQITPETAINFVTVYACVRAIAETISSLPLPIYERLPEGGKRRLTDHPVWRCFNVSPDGYLDAFQWRETCIAHMLQYGNAFNEVQTFRNGDVNLHLIHPSAVKVSRNPDGSVVYQVTSTDRNAIIPGEKMLHFAMLGDGLRGYSPVMLGKDALGLAMSMQSWNSKFFANGCSTTGILTHPGVIPKESAEALRNQITNSHSGDNAHNLIVLQDGMTYTPTTIAPEAAQVLTSRVFQTQEICRLFRIDPAVIGELSRSTFSNVTQQMQSYTTHCIRPMCRRIESAINRTLFRNEPDIFAEHIMEGLLRGDVTTRYQAYSIGRLGGWLSVNEIRELENLNPVLGGDTYLQPLNMADAADGKPESADDGTNDPEGSGIEPPKGDAPDGTLSPIDPSASAVQASLMALQDQLDRMIRKETEAVKRASKQPDGFLNAIDTFYDKHESVCDAAVNPALSVWCALTNKSAPKIAHEIVNTGREELLTLSGECKPTELADQVEHWARKRQQLSKQIIVGLSA